MIKKIKEVTDKILNNGNITYEEAMEFINIDTKDEQTVEALFQGADKIREKFTGKRVDLCSIMNAKSGSCSEDCKFCSQSSHFKTVVGTYELLDYDEVLERAKEAESQGVKRFSLVTSGKGLNGEDFDKVVEIYRRLNNETEIHLCASHGIISYEQALKLKEAGVSMYHHNVETSSDYYSNICTTHSFDDRIETIKNVKKAGLDLCSGGIIGLGENRENRVNMAFELKELGIKSVPLNVLNPIKGTPMEKAEMLDELEILKTMAVYRFIIPNGYIRYAGGRQALKDKQSLGLKAGVNAALVGNYLTTVGSDVESDKEMILKQGLEI